MVERARKSLTTTSLGVTPDAPQHSVEPRYGLATTKVAGLVFGNRFTE